jgi:two-component system sensor histidine kinase KdpD
MSNLLRNAAEATERHGYVRVSAGSVKFPDLNEEFVEIIVEDDGPGIPEEEIGRIFEWNYTTKPEKSGKGMGFGLSWCRALVDSDGGRITAENRADYGAKFKVRYPIRSNKGDMS